MKRSAAWVVILASLVFAGTGSRASDGDELPGDVRRGLEHALAARVERVLDSGGRAYHTGFHPAGTDTYSLILHTQEASDETLVTRRYRLTFSPTDDGRDWEISDEALVDTHAGLHRRVPDDEIYMAFDRFTLSRGGLDLAASAGSLYQDNRAGQPERLVIVAKDLTYDFLPQDSIESKRHALILERHREDLLFEPESLTLACDPGTCRDILSSAFEGLRPIEPDEADAVLMDSLEEERDEVEKARRKDPFSGFRRPYEEGQEYLFLALKQRGEDSYFAVRIDSRAPRDVTVLASGFGRLYSYVSRRLRSSLSPAELSRRPDIPLRDYDLQQVKGTVRLGFSHQEILEADLELTLEAKRPLQEIPFEIARLTEDPDRVSDTHHPAFTIDRLQDGSGRDLTWVKLSPSHGLIVLPEALSPGTRETFRLRYVNTDIVHKFTPNSFHVTRFAWLPLLTYGDFIESLDLTLQVPSRYEVVGVGSSVSTLKQGGVTTTHWIPQEPVDFPALIFGRYRGQPASLSTSEGPTGRVKVRAIADIDSASMFRGNALESIANTGAQSIRLFSRLFGTAYPFGKLDLVYDPGSGIGGQGPSSTVFFGNRAHRPRGPGQHTPAELEREMRSVLPHEVAHQWWGSAVTAAGFSHQWIDESLAEYGSLLYFQAAGGLEEYLTRLDDWRREVLGLEILGCVQDAPLLWTGGKGSEHALTYAKGPYLFHIMRSHWGDERFFSFLRQLATRYRGRAITTGDFEDAAESAFGEPLDWFFDQWVRGVGIPELTLSFGSERSGEGGYVVDGTVRQRILISPRLSPKRIIEGETFRMAVYLSIGDGRKTERQFRLEITEPETPFRFEVPFEPSEVVLNKYGEVLAHDVIVNRRP